MRKHSDQVPWTEDGIQRPQRLMFGGEGKSRATGSTPKPALAPQSSEAAEAWFLLQDTTSIPALEAFVERYANTAYAERAWTRLQELKRRDVIVPQDIDRPLSPRMEIAQWEAIRDSKNVEELKSYLERYPQGAFNKLAMRRLQQLQSETAPAVVASSPSKNGAASSTNDRLPVISEFPLPKARQIRPMR
jgi:hypothetical protein